MSHGHHRAPKSPKPRRLRRLAAGLSLAAAAATIGLTTDTLVAPQADTGWGAPADTGWGSAGGDGTATTLGDSGWG